LRDDLSCASGAVLPISSRSRPFGPFFFSPFGQEKRAVDLFRVGYWWNLGPGLPFPFSPPSPPRTGRGVVSDYDGWVDEAMDPWRSDRHLVLARGPPPPPFFFLFPIGSSRGPAPPEIKRSYVRPVVSHHGPVELRHGGRAGVGISFFPPYPEALDLGERVCSRSAVSAKEASAELRKA